MNTYTILLAAVIFNAGANIMLKAAMRNSPIVLDHGVLATFTQAIKNPHLIAGVMLFGLALAAYSIVLSRINLSIAYPIMTGSGFLLVFLFSALFFKENITAVHLMGSALILAGVYILAK